MFCVQPVKNNLVHPFRLLLPKWRSNDNMLIINLVNIRIDVLQQLFIRYRAGNRKDYTSILLSRQLNNRDNLFWHKSFTKLYFWKFVYRSYINLILCRWILSLYKRHR